MKKRIILTVCIFFTIFAIVLNPSIYIKVSLSAIEVWAKILIPSLFPFFVFTKLLINLGTVEQMSKIFSPITVNVYKTNQSSAYIFFLSILTGYPVGSKLLQDSYNSGKITITQANKIATFTSNSGPMFIIGSVGIGMLADKKIGYIILISHIIGALINGLIYRNIKIKEIDKKENIKIIKNSENNFATSIIDSINSILMVGGIIVIAFILINLINDLKITLPIINFLKIFNINPQLSSAIINGMFEMTKGCLDLSALAIPACLKTSLICGIITFGGISTHLQTMAFLKGIVSYKFFLLQKITHMLISVGICVMLCLIVF